MRIAQARNIRTMTISGVRTVPKKTSSELEPFEIPEPKRNPYLNISETVTYQYFKFVFFFYKTVHHNGTMPKYFTV